MSNFNSFKALFKHQIKAFSLLEMALVLAIMGVIAGATLPMLVQNRLIDKRRVSAQHMDMIMTALGVYAATYNTVPAPASALSQGHPLKEQINFRGLVPYKALGLPESVSKDGFGHPIQYAINTLFSNLNMGGSGEDPNALTILDQKGDKLFKDKNGDKNQKIAVVLISENDAYGHPNGKEEKENMALTRTFYACPYSIVPENLFRHTVLYASYAYLVVYYGKAPHPQTPPSSTSPAPSSTASASSSTPETGNGGRGGNVADDQDPFF